VFRRCRACDDENAGADNRADSDHNEIEWPQGTMKFVVVLGDWVWLRQRCIAHSTPRHGCKEP